MINGKANQVFKPNYWNFVGGSFRKKASLLERQKSALQGRLCCKGRLAQELQIETLF
jgi:hypothetical protein